jgi:amidase
VAADDILDLDATGQLEALAARKVSSVELLKAAMTRHERLKAQINAVVTTDPDRALSRARQIDDQRAQGEAVGVLGGLPMTIKDTFDVIGMPASSGLEAFLGRTVVDAPVVSNTKAAGVVVWGKTNTPVMAGDMQTYNDLYGTTNNPWDVERTPGGSSGGAAAALATGITALEIGSDIGGSLRTPANFCGVFSHKPTWGRVSQVGHVPPAPGGTVERDLNVIGPMARSARDLRLLFPILLGQEPDLKAAPVPVKGLKVGLWVDNPDFVIDAEVRAHVEAFAERLEEAGAVVTPIQPVDSKRLLESYLVLLPHVLKEDMPARMLKGMATIRPLARIARALGAGPFSWAALSMNYTASDDEWAKANQVREALCAEVAKRFEEVDVILAPINPVPAFPHLHKPFAQRKLVCSNGHKIPYLAMLEWISLATALRLPATAIPAGQTNTGLPVGVQIIGARGADERNLAIAHGIEEALGACFVPPPPLGL